MNHLPSSLLSGISLFALLAASPPPAARAALEFPRTTQNLSIAALDAEAVAVFPFKNTGQSPVTLTAIDSGCGCTTGTTAKKTYAPGETGHVRVIFTTGARMGAQSSVLIVRTDAADATGDAKDIPLTVAVDIPEAFIVEPGTLAFARDAKPDDRLNVTVTATGEVPLQNLTATATNEALRPYLARNPANPDQWTLSVTRPNQPGTHSVLISARFPGDIIKQTTLWIVAPASH
ncbi:DUF1573 domain-containing protein [Geminisphaera colitermitum]|uniref:DUF1573 domain-containing protein n=1 Tax=Geminisphaera colitermitum TaxID=1148786 RepID=UPI0005BB7962|nr:DUF1573 domain-containing protein [Geminisphaera colitermitum]